MKSLMGGSAGDLCQTAARAVLQAGSVYTAWGSKPLVIWSKVELCSFIQASKT